MEKYLVEQYDVFEDSKYLTSENEIADYFKDCGGEFLDCGQGYYEDEKNVICKIGDRFYTVAIHAEIMSAKQDVGDRLYWVDNILGIDFKEIEKPLPKDQATSTYNLTMTEDQKRSLELFMKENHIEF
jgi:hypothetical protein